MGLLPSRVTVSTGLLSAPGATELACASGPLYSPILFPWLFKVQPLQGHFWDDGWIGSLSWGGRGGYTHKPKLIKSYTSNRSRVSYVNYTSIKLQTKNFSNAASSYPSGLGPDESPSERPSLTPRAEAATLCHLVLPLPFRGHVTPPCETVYLPVV